MTICPRQMVSIGMRRKTPDVGLSFSHAKIHSLQILAVNPPIFPLRKELSVGCRRGYTVTLTKSYRKMVIP